MLLAVMGGTQDQAGIAAAALTFALKEGVGPLGGILFAGRYGKNFDEDIKKWRFMSTVAFNIALYIECLTLQFPSHFLAMAGLANACKNVTFLLGSASRSTINVQLARKNNIGDIAGKAVSQFTAMNIFGMGIGLGLSKVLDLTAMGQLLPCFMVLSSITLAC